MTGVDGVLLGVAVVVEAAPTPALFEAVIEKVYVVPFVSPVTVQVRLAVATHEAGIEAVGDVTVYELTAAPPLEVGAVQVSTDCALLPDVAAKAFGAVGVVAGTAAAEAAE